MLCMRQLGVLQIKKYKIIKSGLVIYDGPAIATQFCDLIRQANHYSGAQPMIVGDYEVYTTEIARHYEIYGKNGCLTSVYTSLADFSRATGIPTTRLQEVFRMMSENPDMEDDCGRHYVIYDVELDQ